ncbi:MAG: alpha/beta fold hydrolase [Candidatus Cybelea sp.]
MLSKSEVSGLNVFYREAGSEDAPKLVLLHGFPASSHQYRNLLPALGEQFHVIAPDCPGFGNSDTPDRGKDFLPSWDLRISACTCKAMEVTLASHRDSFFGHVPSSFNR